LQHYALWFVLKRCRKELNKENILDFEAVMLHLFIVLNPSRYQCEFSNLGELASRYVMLANFQAEQITDCTQRGA